MPPQWPSSNGGSGGTTRRCGCPGCGWSWKQLLALGSAPPRDWVEFRSCSCAAILRPGLPESKFGLLPQPSTHLELRYPKEDALRVPASPKSSPQEPDPQTCECWVFRVSGLGTPRPLLVAVLLITWAVALTVALHFRGRGTTLEDLERSFRT